MPFIGLFFLVALALSFLELALLVKVSAVFGVVPAILLCFATAVIGSSIARHQGGRTIQRMNEEAAAGRVPANEILEGVMLIIAGVLLLVPGFVTDAAGFAFLIPGLRRSAAGGLRRHFTSRIQVQTFGGFPPGGGFPRDAGGPQFGDGPRPDVIDVDVEVTDADDADDADRDDKR